jgi:hypothetical protein
MRFENIAKRVRYVGIGLALLAFGVLCVFPHEAHAGPGAANAFGLGVEVEGADPINVTGANGNWLVGGGLSLQYWFTPNLGVRAAADYLNNTKITPEIPGDILPFYSGLIINLLSGARASLDLFGDFGQALVNGQDRTYFDAGLELNGPVSSARQFFLEVRWRNVGIGTYTTPYQFVSAGLGINIY